MIQKKKVIFLEKVNIIFWGKKTNKKQLYSWKLTLFLLSKITATTFRVSVRTQRAVRGLNCHHPTNWMDLDLFFSLFSSLVSAPTPFFTSLDTLDGAWIWLIAGATDGPHFPRQAQPPQAGARRGRAVPMLGPAQLPFHRAVAAPWR